MPALLDKITEQVLRQIDSGSGFKQEGAFNLRQNGISLCHGSTEHIKIKKKEDKPGIDVYIDGDTKGEQVHIPVVVSASGMGGYNGAPMRKRALGCLTLVGDFTTDILEAPPLAPRVTEAAALLADAALTCILDVLPAEAFGVAAG